MLVIITYGITVVTNDTALKWMHVFLCYKQDDRK